MMYSALLSMSFMVMAMGVFCFVRPEFAWHLYERDNAMLGIATHQPRDWKRAVYAMGASLVLLGMIGVVVGL